MSCSGSRAVAVLCSAPWADGRASILSFAQHRSLFRLHIMAELERVWTLFKASDLLRLVQTVSSTLLMTWS